MDNSARSALAHLAGERGKAATSARTALQGIISSSTPVRTAAAALLGESLSRGEKRGGLIGRQCGALVSRAPWPLMPHRSTCHSPLGAAEATDSASRLQSLYRAGMNGALDVTSAGLNGAVDWCVIA